MAHRTQSGKSVLYHIPKCGGIYAKEAIRRSGLKYDRCKEMSNNGWLRREHSTPVNIIPEHKVGFSICFVRHPANWYRSFWCFRHMSKFLDLHFPADMLWNNEYESFVINMLDMYPAGFVTNMYQCYIGRDGDDLDFVGKQEDLTDDLVRALTLAGEDFDEYILRTVGPFNVSAGKKKYRDLAVISDETYDRILEVENWVIERFYA